MAAARSSVMACGGESTFAKSIDIWDCFCKCDGVGIIIKIQFSLGHRLGSCLWGIILWEISPPSVSTLLETRLIPFLILWILLSVLLHSIAAARIYYVVKLKVRVMGQMTRPGKQYEGLWQWLLTIFRVDNGLKCCVFVASNDSSPSFCCRGFNFALSIKQLVWTSLWTLHTLQKRNIHVIKY